MSTPTFEPMPEPDRGGSTLVKEETDYRYDPGDSERFAHYAERDKIMEALAAAHEAAVAHGPFAWWIDQQGSCRC